MSKQQTYLQAIQEMRSKLIQAYNAAGWLRDCAINEEKETFNIVRGSINKLENQIELLEQSTIANGRHNMQV